MVKLKANIPLPQHQNISNSLVNEAENKKFFLSERSNFVTLEIRERGFADYLFIYLLLIRGVIV